MELATLYGTTSLQLWHVRRQRSLAFLQRISPASQQRLGFTATVCLWVSAFGYSWSPSAFPPGKCENFFPLCVISPLYLSPAVSWQCSGQVLLLLSLASVLTTFSEGSPSPLPMVSTQFSCVPQPCWSRSSSTSHMILDSLCVKTLSWQSLHHAAE